MVTHEFNLIICVSRDDKTAKRKNSVSWTPFGAIGKAVGGGVQMVGSATKEQNHYNNFKLVPGLGN